MAKNSSTSRTSVPGKVEVTTDLKRVHLGEELQSNGECEQDGQGGCGDNSCGLAPFISRTLAAPFCHLRKQDAAKQMIPLEPV